MRVRLTFADGERENGVDDAGHATHPDHAGSARALYRWLLADPELRGLAEVTAAPTRQEPGHMGGAMEAVDVVVSNLIGLSSLLVGIAAWRGARSRSPRVRIEHDGTAVTLEDASPESVERILRALTADDRDSSGERRAEGAE
jgi:hypothetical protein